MYKKVKKAIVSNYKLIICFVCLIGFLALAEDVFNHDIMKGDIIGYELISKFLIRDNITPIMKIITWFGSAYCLISLTLILFVTIKNKRVGALIGINISIITIINQLLKFILQRPRPTEFRIVNESGYSFPSGHSMISMAFYGFLAYLIYKNIKNKYVKWILIIVLLLLPLLIGISRIYLGVHYTSDVLAGFLISISYLIVYTSIINRIRINKKAKQ
mgnify:CR=1 FL=1